MVMQQNQTQYHDFNLEYGEGGGEYETPPAGAYKIKFLGVVEAKDWPKTTQDGRPVLDDDGEPVKETSLTLQFVIDDPEDDYDGT